MSKEFNSEEFKKCLTKKCNDHKIKVASKLLKTLNKENLDMEKKLLISTENGDINKKDIKLEKEKEIKEIKKNYNCHYCEMKCTMSCNLRQHEKFRHPEKFVEEPTTTTTNTVKKEPVDSDYNIQMCQELKDDTSDTDFFPPRVLYTGRFYHFGNGEYAWVSFPHF